MIAIVLAAVLAAFVASCNAERDASAPGPLTALPEANSTLLSEELMIALTQAKNFHHKADIYSQEGKLAQATGALNEILAIPFPADAPEGEDIRLDARARLAKLLLSQNETDAALQTVDAGIASSERQSFFLANLYTVKGEIHETMALAFDRRGTAKAKADAAAARRAAIAAFDESIRINRSLQEALTKGEQP